MASNFYYFKITSKLLQNYFGSAFGELGIVFIVMWPSPPFSNQEIPIKISFGMSSFLTFVFKDCDISSQVPLLD